MRWLFAVALTLLASPVLAAAPSTDELRNLQSQTQTAAMSALQTLRQLVDTENARELGFETPVQLQEASIGQPMLDFLIRLDELRSYHRGQDPAKLLHRTEQVVYPITFQGQTRSSITLLRKANQWRTVSFGGSQLAKARSQVREAVVVQVPGGAAETFQVRIPALNAVFVGHRVNGPLMLTPVITMPDLGLQAGRTMQAREVLELVQPIAQQINPKAPS